VGALMTPMLILLFGITPSTAISSDAMALRFEPEQLAEPGPEEALVRD
jgi:hypothetical protein